MMKELVSLKSLLEKEEKTISNYNANIRMLDEENEYFEKKIEEYTKLGLKDAFEREHFKTIKMYSEDIKESFDKVKEIRREIKKYFEMLD